MEMSVVVKVTSLINDGERYEGRILRQYYSNSVVRQLLVYVCVCVYMCLYACVHMCMIVCVMQDIH